MSESARIRRTLIALLPGAFLFWALRIRYWANTHELPFSDMLSYETFGQNVASSFLFQAWPFWQTYWPPGTGTLRGLVILITGSEALLYWRIFLGLLTFLALLWLARELRHLTCRLWPGALLILLVALSRSSIFWSLKVATEGPGEAFLYGLAAACLRLLRIRTGSSAFLLGLLLSAAFLTRANFATLLPVLGTMVLLRRDGEGIRIPWGWRLDLRAGLLMLAGLSLLWVPWMARNARLYGAVVPFTTQAPFTFLGEIEPFEVPGPDGDLVSSDQEGLMTRLARESRNDHEAMRYAQAVVLDWISSNRSVYPKMIRRRALRSFKARRIYLTQVPRKHLFAGPIEFLLVDKSPFFLLSGLLGYLCWACSSSPRLALLPLLCLLPWATSLPFLGIPRMLEPFVPLLLAGNLGFLPMTAGLARRVGRVGGV
jgi:hypothetical protein